MRWFASWVRNLALEELFFNDTATTEIYTLSLHDALPISHGAGAGGTCGATDRAHQPDECHLHPAQRGGNRAAERGVPDGPGDRPFRQLWPDRRDAVSGGGAGAGGGHVSAELPRVGQRGGASHGGAAGRDRRGSGPTDRRDPVRRGTTQSSRAALPGRSE